MFRKLVQYPITAILLLVLTQFAFSQGRLEPERFHHGIVTDVYAYPSGKTNSIVSEDDLSQSNCDLFVTYNVNRNFLIFVKENNHYSASFELFVEITDSAKNYIVRESNVENIHVKEQNSVEPKPNTDKPFISQNHKGENNPSDKLPGSEEKDYCGFFKFNLKKGKYTINLKYLDKNSKIEYDLFPINVDLTFISDSITEFTPMVIETKHSMITNKPALELMSNGNKILFSDKAFDIFIPVPDTSVQNIELAIKNNDTVFTFVSNEYKYLSIDLSNSDGNLFLIDTGTFKSKVFYFKEITSVLSEGDCEIKITLNFIQSVDNSALSVSKVKNVQTKVVWLNKPGSLRDIEVAILALKAIENEFTISYLIKGDEEEQRNKLKAYWQKIDPTPDTQFNELMDEYYRRVDYCIDNFSLLNKRNGFESDRGTAYLRYGKPDSIERGISNNGKIIEVWKYRLLDFSLNFIDKNGNGNFQIIRQ